MISSKYKIYLSGLSVRSRDEVECLINCSAVHRLSLIVQDDDNIAENFNTKLFWDVIILTLNVSIITKEY